MKTSATLLLSIAASAAALNATSTNEVHTIECRQKDSCKGFTFDLDQYPASVTIECLGESSCADTTFTQSTSNGSVTLNCASKDSCESSFLRIASYAQVACVNEAACTDIDGNFEGGLDISCRGKDSCKASVLSIPLTAPYDIVCQGENACQDMVVHRSTTTPTRETSSQN